MLSIFHVLIDLCICSLKTCLFRFLAQFLIGLFVFLLLAGKNYNCEKSSLDSVNSVTQSRLTLQPHALQHTRLPVHHQLPELAQTHIHWVYDTINHLILCRPLLLLPSIFPSLRIFSSESVLHIRWPKHFSFSFSISPSNEYSGLISCRIDWFDLLAVQGTLKSLLQHHSSKHQFFGTQLSLWSNSHIHTWPLEKP